MSGRLPIEFIQATRPIVIMDEPQNMESEQARAAIQSMNPLCTLRYSATHRHLYNLLYQLNPVKAYELKLVKRIEVTSVMEQPDFNQTYVFVESITATKSKVTAKLVIDKHQAQGPVRTKISVSKNGEDLFKLSGNREAYRDYIVDYIDAGSGMIVFANGTALRAGQTLGGQTEDLMRVQIYETVNESYEDFARELQTEIESDCGVQLPKAYIDQASKRKKIHLVSKWRENQDFLELWSRIKHKTRYSVRYEPAELIRLAAEAVRQMPVISKPNIVTQKRGVDITQQDVSTSLFSISENQSSYKVRQIPDLVGYIQRETELTRGAIAEILISSGRLDDLWVNPQQFIDFAIKSIRESMEKLMVDGIKYEKVAGAEYEMLLFEQEEISSYINRMIPVNHSIYDAIEYDSEVERQFAQKMDTRTDVKMFLKLPRWFQIDTPLGKYNPDWAIVLGPEGEEAKLYFVAETKSTHDENKRRNSENAKIRCGEAHFKTLPGVTFKTVTSALEI